MEVIEQKLLKRNHFCCRNKSHGENPTRRSLLPETDPGLEVRRSQQDVAVVDQLDDDAERQRRRRRRRSAPDHSADASSCHRHFADRQLEICPGTTHFSHLRFWSKVFNWIWMKNVIYRFDLKCITRLSSDIAAINYDSLYLRKILAKKLNLNWLKMTRMNIILLKDWSYWTLHLSWSFRIVMAWIIMRAFA